MSKRRKVTIVHLLARKRERQKIPVLTCYDYSTARVLEEAGIDVLLVGDTYAEVCLGYDSTVSVTVDEMLVVTRAVRRGAPGAFLIGDMPFLSYQVSDEEAVRNAGRFLAEAGCDCVKVEVDRRLAGTVEAMARASVPVMAHLGLRPQSIHQLGAYRCQGKTAEQAARIIEDARIMEEAGASALLLEAVTNEVAQTITEKTALPVIGCVSGPHCDGQVLVFHDVMGYASEHRPSAVKTYANLHETIKEAASRYADEIVQEKYPTPSQGVCLPETELKKLQTLLGEDA
ncbi:MAG: 3-methyl-2-oxobutanoate hydroxymethyltransferase [Phycisphaerae bacterium]